MLDILLDPALIALYGTVGGGLGVKMFQKRVTGRVEVEIKPETTPDKVDDDDYDMCMVWTERYFEYKLVEAKALAVIDMTTCDNNFCENCRVTYQARRDAARAAQWRERREAELERKALALAEDAELLRKKRELLDANEADRIKLGQAKASAKAAADKADQEARLALLTRMQNSDNIKKAVLSSGAGPVVTLHQIYDPDDGEYLGSVRIGEDGEVVKFNESLLAPKANSYAKNSDKSEHDASDHTNSRWSLKSIPASRRVAMLWAGEFDHILPGELANYIPMAQIAEYLRSGKPQTPRHGVNCDCCDRFADTRKFMEEAVRKHKKRRSSEYT